MNVHVTGLPADERLVRFHFAIELEPARFHRESDAVKQEPRGLLSNADGPMNLPRANAVLRVRNHPHGRQPLVQAERGIFHDRAELHRELFLAALALPHAARRNERMLRALATRASDAVRLAKRHNEVVAVVGVREMADRLNQSFQGNRGGVVRVHANILDWTGG